MQRFSEPQGNYRFSPPERGLYNLHGHQTSQATPAGSGTHDCTKGLDGDVTSLPSYRAMTKTNGYQYSHSNDYGPNPRTVPAISRGSNTLSEFQPYFLDRGNGQFTRLIPADMLPPLNEVPAREASVVGKVVLQPISSRERRVTIKALNQESGTDKVQHRIDDIIGSTPTKPRRDKIYCDKWVHEGICAFAQQGCRYKHEMPQDLETQCKLGLYQGLPAWWRKQQAEINQRELNALNAMPSPSRGGTLGTAGRRATVTHDLRSPNRRQELPPSTTASSAIENDLVGVRISGGVEEIPRAVDSYFVNTNRWTGEPAAMSMGKQGLQELHGRRVGVDSCVWGPIEPPKSLKMRMERDDSN